MHFCEEGKAKKNKMWRWSRQKEWYSRCTGRHHKSSSREINLDGGWASWALSSSNPAGQDVGSRRSVCSGGKAEGVNCRESPCSLWPRRQGCVPRARSSCGEDIGVLRKQRKKQMLWKGLFQSKHLQRMKCGAMSILPYSQKDIMKWCFHDNEFSGHFSPLSLNTKY